MNDRLYKMYDRIKELAFQLIEALIFEIQINEERQPNGQRLKSAKFKLPIMEEDMGIGLGSDTHVECAVRMTKAKN